MDFDDELLPLLDDDEDKYEERLMRPMLQPSTLAIVSVGQDFLRKAEADNISWGALNHHALQPSSLMSCRAAQKVWEASCHDILPRWKCELINIKAPTLGFIDRCRELAEAGHSMSVDTFRSRSVAIPLVPRMVSILQQL